MGDWRAMAIWRTWREAMSAALYGPDGFFRTQAPADHFRTSVHVSPVYAEALLSLARQYELDTVVDVGAGRGELLAALHQLDPELGLCGVEVAERPPELPAAVTWVGRLPEVSGALVVANEWLDNVPLDVAEVDSHGVARMVLVDVASEGGEERLGDPVSGADEAWLRQWWPLDSASPGSRAEIGRPRDDAWAFAVRQVRRGVLVAVDYGHLADSRPYDGTLTGYRGGQMVHPVPDGSCDVTAHVAIDAVAAAGEAAGATGTTLSRQGDALRSLGLDPRRPPLAMARTDPAGYLAALARASEQSELVAPGGLGDFQWLRQLRGL
ncbi:SAM-dependent methyltransferase [Flindersiella endophytica]